MRAKVLVGGFALVIALAACGSSSKSSGGSTTPTTTATAVTGPVSKTLGQGVTDKEIKVGVSIVDFDKIKQFIDFNHGDEQATTQVFIDALNKAGGINGRQIKAVYKKYTPIGSTGPTEVCTAFTEDQKVFAVLGNIEDPTGASQKCVTKGHNTVMIGHDLTDPELVAAPGLMLTPDISAERRLNVLMSVLKKENTLQGKKVAVLAETNTKARAKQIIDPASKDMGVQQGTTAVLAVGEGSTDTTQAQAQLDSFIERWKGEGINAIIISGPDAVARQIVEKVKKEMPDVQLLTDAESSAAGSGQDEVAAHTNPNPYEGMLTANGLPDQQAFETPTVQKCVKIYEDATHTKVIAPVDLKPNAEGDRVQVYVAIEDICRELAVFTQIATKAGPYLNNDNWIAAANALGHVNDLPASEFASITQGKYDADDSFALAAFDSKVNDFKPVSPIVDAAAP